MAAKEEVEDLICSRCRLSLKYYGYHSDYTDCIKALLEYIQKLKGTKHVFVVEVPKKDGEMRPFSMHTNDENAQSLKKNNKSGDKWEVVKYFRELKDD